MSDKLKEFLKTIGPIESDKDGDQSTQPLKVAAVVLLSEMARVDDDLDRRESAEIVRIMDQEFHLSEAEAEELSELAAELQRNPAKVDHCIALVCKSFTETQKEFIMAMTQKVAEADGRLDKFEQMFSNYLRTKLGLVK